jgi:hypothetical protein
MKSIHRHRPQDTVRKPEKKARPFFSAQSHTVQAKEEPPFFQAKLAIGKPGDAYEREADAVADAVVSGDTATPLIQKRAISSIQRTTLATPAEDEKLGTAEARMEKDKLVQEKPEIQRMGAPEEEEPVQMQAEEEEPVQMQTEEEEPVQMQAEEEEPVQAKEEEEEPLQMQAEEEEPIQAKEEEEEPLQAKSQPGQSASVASAKLSNQIQSSRGNGAPLPEKTRAEMETAFGVDFRGVNVHTDNGAIQMNRELGAQAFTHGSDVYFNSGKFNPETSGGKHLLAHELTHVVQQEGVSRQSPESNLVARSTENAPANSANTPAVDHFYIELKAWIPHSRVVDPEENLRASNWLEGLGGPISGISPLQYEYHSFYRGDHHSGYPGSYRVLSVIEFDWDGTTISGFTHQGFYGTSHRDFNYKLTLDNQWPIPDLNIENSDSESETATETTDGVKTSSNSFVVGLASANPLVMTWAPDIDSRLSGGFRAIEGVPSLVLDYSTDLFPSHGFSVRRNGVLITRNVVNDASGKIVLGAIGAAVIGHGLTSQTNNGNVVIPL